MKGRPPFPPHEADERQDQRPALVEKTGRPNPLFLRYTVLGVREVASMLNPVAPLRRLPQSRNTEMQLHYGSKFRQVADPVGPGQCGAMLPISADKC